MKKAGIAGVVTRFAAAGVSVILTPLLVRALGPDSYGVYAALTALATLLAFADLGVGQGMVSRFAAETHVGGKEAQRRLVSNALCLTIVAVVVLIPIGLASAWAMPWPRLFNSTLPDHEVRLTVSCFTTLFFLGIPLGLGQRILQGQQRGVEANLWLFASALSSILSATCGAIAGLALPWVVTLTMAPIVLVNALQFLILLAIDASLRPRFSDIHRDALQALMGAGSLFVVLNLVVAFAYQMDVLIVSYVIGAATAAVLAVNVKLFGLIVQLNAAYLQQFWPAVAEAAAKGDHAWIRANLWGAVANVAKLVGPTLLVLAAIIRPAVDLLFGSAYQPSWALVAGLAVWSFQQCLGYPFAMLLNGLGIVAFQVTASTIMGVANLALSVILVRHVGISGAVWASSITHLCILLIPTILYVRLRLPRYIASGPSEFA